jgi:predicted nuclease of restriction endonuclease-like (RecB) superfamily
MSAKNISTKLPDAYHTLLKEIKNRIHSARSRSILAVNKELIELYWGIGRLIIKQQEAKGWGKSIVEQLSKDIRREFPNITGFSPQNIWYMRSFYFAWTKEVKNLQQPVGDLDGQNLPRVVKEVPWGHNIILLSKLKNPSLRIWYAQKIIENGWSRSVLTAQVESQLHERQGKVLSNFKHTLPEPQSDLARQTFKDPYIFDFISFSEKITERGLENALLENIMHFLLELGSGFAFIGRQHHLEVDGDDFYIDLLFYHIQLRCYIVIDLKLEKFKPEFAGKMNFYLATVDAQLRNNTDEPSIGLILCKEKNKVVVEYALSGTKRPVGVAKWQLTRKLPIKLKHGLPEPEKIEKAIEQKLNALNSKNK